MDQQTGRSALVAYIEERSIPEPNTGCWLWLLALTDEGYGKATNPETGKRTSAQRLAYESVHGPLDPSLEPDHLCRVRCCANPAHLEAVTHKENQRRGTSFAATQAAQTHCLRGHLLLGENLRVSSDGHRHCVTCTALKGREHYERNRSKIIARTRARKQRIAAELQAEGAR